jgi:hypothetical protein
MTLSLALGLLSLLGYLAIIGWAVWETWVETNAQAEASGWRMGNHTSDDMPKAIDWALRHCLDRGQITIKGRGSPYAIRFAKYKPPLNKYRLEFAFPLTDLSTPFVPQLRTALMGKGFPFRETRDEEGVTCLSVDCDQDADKAVELARLCFFELFGLPADTRFETKPKNYSTLQDHVDNPNYIDQGSLSERWKLWQERALEKGQTVPPLGLMLKFAGCAFGIFFGHPILLVAWLGSDSAAPDWQVASLWLQGHWNIAILFFIFCGLFVELRRTNRQLKQYRAPPPTTPCKLALVNITFLGLPLAVIGSWLGV